MTGRPGEALDTDEAVAVLLSAQITCLKTVPPRSGPADRWFAFLSALNEQDVVLVWDGEPDPPSAAVDCCDPDHWFDGQVGRPGGHDGGLPEDPRTPCRSFFGENDRCH